MSTITLNILVYYDFVLCVAVGKDCDLLSSLSI
jgi:hypothetical protein